MRRLLDAYGEVVSVFEDVPSEDGFLIRSTFDEVPVIEHNKKLQNEGDGYSPSREFRRVASIPNGLIYQWLLEGLNFYDKNHWPAIKRKLNSSEYKWLRTAPGSL